MTAPRRRLRKLLLAGNVVAVLAATAVLGLNYIGTVTANQAKACEQEYITLQAGLRAYMAENNLATVPESTYTIDMTSPVRLNSKTGPATNYVPYSHTRWAYTWDSEGRVTAITHATNGPTVPAGCVVSG